MANEALEDLENEKMALMESADRVRGMINQLGITDMVLDHIDKETKDQFRRTLNQLENQLQKLVEYRVDDPAPPKFNTSI